MMCPVRSSLKQVAINNRGGGAEEEAPEPRISPSEEATRPGPQPIVFIRLVQPDGSGGMRSG
jgi:hypothetical protein